MEILACSEEETSHYFQEFDPDYEFDAPRFFDFTRPETPPEDEEADGWFDRVPSCPPSPFVAKLCRGVPLSLDNVKKAQDLERQPDRRTINNYAASEEDAVSSGINPYNDAAEQDPPPRVAAKLISQSYMKPTASYLAKQKQSQELQFHRILRSRNVVEDHNTSSNSSSTNEIQATKRQKLDIGYLQKIIHAKPRSPLQHKVAKMERKMDDWILGRPKVTIPREFFLETARRATRHRAKNESVSIGQVTSNFQTSKARASKPKEPSVLRMKKTTLQTVEDSKIPAAKQPLPVELLKNLSIDSEIQPISRYQSAWHASKEDSKENEQLLLKQGHEMLDAAMEKPFRSSGKQFWCGRDTSISDHRSQTNFNKDYFYGLTYAMGDPLIQELGYPLKKFQ